jgi:hypothetical protein
MAEMLWPDSSQAEIRPVWSPDSGNIDRMLSDFGIGKISMMVDCLNVKVDCIV